MQSRTSDVSTFLDDHAPKVGESHDLYVFETGGVVIIASDDPAADARWLRWIEIESDRDRLLGPFTD